MHNGRKGDARCSTDYVPRHYLRAGNSAGSAVQFSQGFLGPLAFFGAGLGSNSGYVTTCQRWHHEPGLKRGRPQAGFRSGSRGVEPPAGVQQILVGGERKTARARRSCLLGQLLVSSKKGFGKKAGRSFALGKHVSPGAWRRCRSGSRGCCGETERENDGRASEQNSESKARSCPDSTEGFDVNHH